MSHMTARNVTLKEPHDFQGQHSEPEVYQNQAAKLRRRFLKENNNGGVPKQAKLIPPPNQLQTESSSNMILSMMSIVLNRRDWRKIPFPALL